MSILSINSATIIYSIGGKEMKKEVIFLFFITSIFAVDPNDLLSLGSLDLKAAEEIAFRNNKPYLIANEGVKQADYRKNQAVSRWLPKVEYEATYLRGQKPLLAENYLTGAFTLVKNQYSSILELTQPLFSTDLIYNLTSKKLEAESSRLFKENSYNDLLLQVRANYYSVVLYKIDLGIQKENISYLTNAMSLEQKQLQAGNSTSYQVNQSKVSVANAITKYYSTLKNYQNARNALMQALGIEPYFEKILSINEEDLPIFSIPDIKTKLEAIQEGFAYQYNQYFSTEQLLKKIDSLEESKRLILYSEKEVEKYIELALKSRPDLKEQQIQIAIADELIKKKKGKYLPEVSGFFDYTYNGGYLGEKSFFNEPYQWQGGIKLSWTIFDSLLRENKIKEAKAKKVSTALQYQYASEVIELDIRNILYKMEESLFSYLSAHEAVLLAEQAMAEAKDKLDFGKIPPIDFRETANSLAQARNELNKASYSLLLSYYQLRYATGQDIRIGI
jgi:outer membrane protein TolC